MAALVELFTPLDPQGPGDVDFSLELMHRLPELTGTAPIGDFGCGTSVTALPLARHFNRKVIGVDLSADFINVMEQRGRRRPAGCFRTDMVQGERAGQGPRVLERGIPRDAQGTRQHARGGKVRLRGVSHEATSAVGVVGQQLLAIHGENQ